MASFITTTTSCVHVTTVLKQKFEFKIFDGNDKKMTRLSARPAPAAAPPAPFPSEYVGKKYFTYGY